MTRSRSHSRRGASIFEVLVGAGLAVVIVAAAVPSLATVGCTSFRAKSRANLAALSQAHVAYAATWGDRQFTLVPDDVGAFGSCANYVAQGNCIPDVLLGSTCEGTPVKFSLGCSPTACTNFAVASPLSFNGVSAGFGSYRLPNAAGFNAYVDGRFYSSTFYAPDDYAIAGEVEPYLASPCGYSGPPNEIVYSSYCNSPAAMLGLGVLSRQSGYKSPNTLAEGYKSPTVSQCTYPNLKTRMMEFRAVDVDCYPDPGDCPNYQFNQMYESRSLGLMFDGSVRIITPRAAMESDKRATIAAPAGMIEKGLWVRGTPFGQNGVGGGGSTYDFLVDTSFHFLTGDGIAGRDILDW